MWNTHLTYKLKHILYWTNGNDPRQHTKFRKKKQICKKNRIYNFSVPNNYFRNLNLQRTHSSSRPYSFIRIRYEWFPLWSVYCWDVIFGSVCCCPYCYCCRARFDEDHAGGHGGREPEDAADHQRVYPVQWAKRAGVGGYGGGRCSRCVHINVHLFCR